MTAEDWVAAADWLRAATLSAAEREGIIAAEDPANAG